MGCGSKADKSINALGDIMECCHDTVFQRSTCWRLCLLLSQKLYWVLAVGFRKACSFPGVRQHFGSLVHPGFCWICCWGCCLQTLYCRPVVAPRKAQAQAGLTPNITALPGLIWEWKITFSLVSGLFWNTFLNHNKVAESNENCIFYNVFVFML